MVGVINFSDKEVNQNNIDLALRDNPANGYDWFCCV